MAHEVTESERRERGLAAARALVRDCGFTDAEAVRRAVRRAVREQVLKQAAALYDNGMEPSAYVMRDFAMHAERCEPRR